jgi:tungstate transport system ATP-binding protein
MLEVEQLAISCGATRVLEDVGFAVPEGQAVSLPGGDGSGKTTVLIALHGIVRPAAAHAARPHLRHARAHARLRRGAHPDRAAALSPD